MVLVCYLGKVCFPNSVKENMPYSRIYCEPLNFAKFTSSEVLTKIHPVEICAKACYSLQSAPFIHKYQNHRYRTAQNFGRQLTIHQML